mmetsp:Transcript_53374/g.79323  ORF Transcript_53374/g.79323 Transcript_53374/m.79323 type:complete len:81 (+) Transcript_53374:627-869(+)
MVAHAAGCAALTTEADPMLMTNFEKKPLRDGSLVIPSATLTLAEADVGDTNADTFETDNRKRTEMMEQMAISDIKRSLRC